MRIVIAIGGNSLIMDNDSISPDEQYEQILKTGKNLIEILKDPENEIVITHGNGPQVGFLLRMSENSNDVIPEYPLDYCVANTQGAMGYQIQNALSKIMHETGINRKVVTIITQVKVSSKDKAFINPSKPIGSFFTEKEILKHSSNSNWKFIEDAGRGFRRVVPSPDPIDIIEKDCILSLLKNNYIVIACGGGGIPVVKEGSIYKGVEAVIDKDLASSLLAIQIKADLFIITTSIDYAYIDYNKDSEKALKNIDVFALEKFQENNHFHKGSMEPKIRAVIEFTKNTKNRSIITSPENISMAIKGRKGTQINP
jgi:carbamate kinase